MTAPLVSVLMIVRVRDDHVGDAIDSVLRQTLDDLELVVVDDGADVAARDAIHARIHDGRVRALRVEAEDGSGPNAGRTVALAHARGAYIQCVDADQALLPTCLETMLHVARRHPDAGLLLWSTPEPGAWPRALSPEEVYERVFVQAAQFERPSLSVLCRREDLLAAGGFEASGPFTTDTDLVARLARRTHVVLGPPGLVFHRRRGVGDAGSPARREAAAEARTLALLRALEHDACPLPAEVRERARSRILRAALRNSVGGAIRAGHWRKGLRSLRRWRASPLDLLAAFTSAPSPAAPARASVGPVPGTLPHASDPESPATGLLSVLVLAPPGSDSATLIDAAVRLPHAPEVIVCERFTATATPRRRADESSRVRHVVAAIDSSPDELLSAGAEAASGRYLAFAEAGRSSLHPHVLEAALEALERPGMPDVAASGPLSGMVGLLRLDARDAVALEVGSNGGVLGDEPSSLLVRREAFRAARYGGFGAWDPGVLGRAARLVVGGGALLGPEGLSTRWQAGSIRAPTRFEASELVALFGATPREGWRQALHASYGELLARLTGRCRGDVEDWLLPRLTGSLSIA